MEFRGGSDHKLLRVTRFTKSMKNSARYVRKRSFKNFNQAQFCEAVKKISWFDLCMCQDPSQAAELLTSKLTVILDQMAPIKTFQIRSKYAPWMSLNTKQLLKERNLAQENAAQTQHPEDWLAYKNLRNTETTKMRQEKKLWEEHKLNDPSTLWSSVKSWLSWGNSGPPSKLLKTGMDHE